MHTATRWDTVGHCFAVRVSLYVLTMILNCFAVRVSLILDCFALCVSLILLLYVFAIALRYVLAWFSIALLYVLAWFLMWHRSDIVWFGVAGQGSPWLPLRRCGKLPQTTTVCSSSAHSPTVSELSIQPTPHRGTHPHTNHTPHTIRPHIHHRWCSTILRLYRTL